MDRKKLIKETLTPPIKPSQHTRDCGAIRSRHNKIKKCLNIEIIIKYLLKNVKPTNMFEIN